MTPKRIQLSRQKNARKPKDAINVARPTKWGNPYPLSLYEKDYPDSTRGEQQRMCVSDFRGLAEGRWDGLPDTPKYPDLIDIIGELRGHDLACWCGPSDACHTDVLLELANQPIPKENTTSC